MLIYLQMLETPEEKSLFEQIYLEYRGLMYHVAYEILHNEQDAEDAVHQAFVKIAENIKKIDDPVCPQTHNYSLQRYNDMKQKIEPTYTKTSLFLCEKRRFLWPELRKEWCRAYILKKERGKYF